MGRGAEAERDRQAFEMLRNYVDANRERLPGQGTETQGRIIELVDRLAVRSEDDRREASKLLVDVAKVAITLSAGAIAVAGALIRDKSSETATFWLYVSSMVLFILSIGCSLTVATRTIERAGGAKRGVIAWEYQREESLMSFASLFGGVAIMAFFAATTLS